LSLPATDNFNRADSNPVGGNWSTGNGFNACKIASNTLAPANVEACSQWNADTFNADQYSQCNFAVLNDGGPAVRISSSSKSCYLVTTQSGGNTTAQIVYKVVAGSYTQLSSTLSNTISTSSVLKMSATGTTIEYDIDGSMITQITDASLSTGSAGIWFYDSDLSARADNWQGGNIGGTNYSVSDSESGAASDSASTVFIGKPSHTESGSAADVPSTTMTSPQSVTESGSASDSPSALRLTPASVTEAGSSVDTPSTVFIGKPAHTESGAAADTPSTLMIGKPSITEAGSATDAPSAVNVSPQSVTESGAASDTSSAVTGTNIYSVSVTEAGSATDVESGVMLSPQAVSESGSATDTPAASSIKPVSVSEAGNASDTSSYAFITPQYIIESGNAVDSPQIVMISPQSVSEAGSASDVSSLGAMPFVGKYVEGDQVMPRYFSDIAAARTFLDQAPKRIFADTVRPK
jgi:hypothetical protein